MKILNHRLCDDNGQLLDFRRSPNQSSGVIIPEYLVIHYTAGASAESAINWLRNPQSQASAHLVISRDGDITQLVAFNRKAWHAGRSQWDGRSGLNSFSIGIELDNYGVLQGEPGNWRTGWERKVNDDEVSVLPDKFDGVERAWHIYTEVQLATALQVGTLIARHYRLRDVVGHDEIAPGRKRDPGPSFPMDSFRAAVIGRADDDPDRYETTTALNIRTGPGTQHDKLPQSPLSQGTQLELISTSGVWYNVDVLDNVGGDMDVNGWVHKRYVRRV